MGSKNSRNYVQFGQEEIETYNTVSPFDIVWLDESSRETLLQDPSYSHQIQSLEEYNLRFFEETVVCAEYLYKLSTNAKVLLLVPEQWAEEMVQYTHSLCQIKCIFVVHLITSSTGHAIDLSPEYGKVEYINLNQVADQIRYYETRFLRTTTEFFSIDVFNAGQIPEMSSTEINGRFLFSQLLLDIFLRMESKLNDKDELICRCSQLYAENREEMKKVEEFHRDYKREKVFEWYSKDAFIFRLLNQAFRTLNIDMLFLFRFFMQDLQNQLTLHQEQSRVCVYRGQLLSKEEWKRLSSAQGQYISMSSFLSTSLQEKLAESFIFGANDSVTKSDKLGVLFQIEANPHLPGGVKPFAKIARSNSSEGENEILFMAGCIFRVTEVIHKHPFPIVKMELCSNKENKLKVLFESLRSEYGGQESGKECEADLNSFGIILYNMDKFDMADRFFRRIYHETSNNDPNRARYCQNIGNVAYHYDRYQESAQWYDRALEIYEKNGAIDHPALGNLHLVRGNLYSKMNKRRHALASYEKALTIYRTNFGENYPKVALCYCNMAYQFKRPKHYQTSVQYLERALRIAENTLPEIHPDLIHYHLSLATLLLNLRHRELQRAQAHIQTALRIANAALPPEHPSFLAIYEILGYTYELMGDFEQSTVWYNAVGVLSDLQPAKAGIDRVWTRKKVFICTRCHRHVWIYRSFEWMKDTRLNCWIFHDFGSFLLNIVRYCCHY